jgi:hypothetical protein
LSINLQLYHQLLAASTVRSLGVVRDELVGIQLNLRGAFLLVVGSERWITGFGGGRDHFHPKRTYWVITL